MYPLTGIPFGVPIFDPQSHVSVFYRVARCSSAPVRQRSGPLWWTSGELAEVALNAARLKVGPVKEHRPETGILTLYT